jgi:hypothetical protein
MKKWHIGLLAFIGLVIAGALFLGLATPQGSSFAFVKADHPIDMWQDGKDRWAYYSVGDGSSKELAALARKELVGKGFTEVKTGKPWFRFTNGDQEVLVCNHSEFAVNGGPSGSKLDLHPAIDKNPWPCVLVKNGPGTSGSLAGFQVKKLVLRW